MTALLEYSDPDCSIRASRSFLANSVPKKWGGASPSPPHMVTVTNLMICNIITTRNKVTNVVSNPLSNAQPQQSNEAY